MNWILGILTMTMLAACGGGTSVSAGLSVFNTGTGGTTPTAIYLATVDVQRAGSSTILISSTETVQAVATVISAAGSPVEGVIVTFSQSPAPLVTFYPLIATALTDVNGHAKLDLGAISASNVGATTIQAVAQIGSISVTASRTIQIAAALAASPGGIVLPALINFIGAVPNGTAIVIKGAGGNGRTESALLTFQVLDSNNAPVNAAIVDFKLNEDSGGAKIASSQSASSNSNGFVKVTAVSGTQPASIIVVAKARAVSNVITQSDTLVVSNSVAVTGSFEIVSEKYNLNGALTGDETKIIAYVSDRFGNPVADGLAVSFQTDYGSVAYSTIGGCLTLQGTCTVPFRVQNPRGDGIATVRASVQVGGSITIEAEALINMAGASDTSNMLIRPNGAIATTLLLNKCKQTFELRVSDGNQRATAAGTAITVPFQSTGSVVTIKVGSPVEDQLALGFPPTDLVLEIDLSSSLLTPACKTDGVVSESSNFFLVSMKPPRTNSPNQRIVLAYPQ